MRGQAGFWDIDERYARLSEADDPLEVLNVLGPWEGFSKPLTRALKRSDGAKGGKPPFMWFLGLALKTGCPTPRRSGCSASG